MFVITKFDCIFSTCIDNLSQFFSLIISKKLQDHSEGPVLATADLGGKVGRQADRQILEKDKNKERQRDRANDINQMNDDMLTQ